LLFANLCPGAAAVTAVGAVPFVSFKDNSRGMDHPNEHWRRMFAYFDLRTPGKRSSRWL
jgi:hypothetical protein